MFCTILYMVEMFLTTAPRDQGLEKKMEKPTFKAYRIQKDGKPAVELVVRNSLYSKELHETVQNLGYELTVDMRNRRSIVCTSPEEVNTARDPLVKFFDEKGEWK